MSVFMLYTSYTKLKINLVGKVATQCVAATGRTQDAQFTFAYYKGNRPELFWALYINHFDAWPFSLKISLKH